jgi:mannonate dehydratase
MEISLRLSNLTDDEFRFITQIGVERVDVHNPLLVPGYEEQGERYLRNVPEVLRKIRSWGLEVASFRFSSIRNALFGRPEGEREVENLRRLIRVLGRNDVCLIQVDFHGARIGPGRVPGRYGKEQRGGYVMDAFSLERMRAEIRRRDMGSPYAHHFTESLDPEDHFRNCVSICRRIAPILEDSGVKMAIHGDDPPVSEEGLLPGLTTSEMILRLFEEVPSENCGILFCTGTRYESGLDIYEQIRAFGPRIFHVHFRNVRGTLSRDGGYEEVMPDDGEMDMLEVLRALDSVGYRGSLNPDHFPVLADDTPERNAGRAFAVGHTRALLSAL